MAYLKASTPEAAAEQVIRWTPAVVPDVFNPRKGKHVLTVFTDGNTRARFTGQWRKGCTDADRLITGKRSDLHANPFALLKTFSKLDTTHVVIERLPDDAESDLAAACDLVPGVTVIVIDDETKLGPLFGSVPKAA